METSIELLEFIEQVNYCLSLEFVEKWRHKYSSHFLKIFQDRILRAFETHKTIKLSSLYTSYTKKHKYNEEHVSDFFRDIDISLYYPLVYDDSWSKKSKKR